MFAVAKTVKPQENYLIGCQDSGKYTASHNRILLSQER
jgi:hypothetical protein